MMIVLLKLALDISISTVRHGRTRRLGQDHGLLRGWIGTMILL